MAEYALLAAELATDPLARGYAGMTNAQAAYDLNTRYRTRAVPTQATTRTLLARMDPAMAASILDALTAATAPTVKWAMAAFESGGLDVGHPHTRAQIDALVPAVLTAEQAAALKAVGEQPVSRAVEVWGWGVSEYDVARARA